MKKKPESRTQYGTDADQACPYCTGVRVSTAKEIHVRL
jgi:hypothetical protein